MGVLRLVATTTVLGGMTLALMPLQSIATRRNWPMAARLPHYWQRVARRMIGLRVRVEGQPAQPPLLIAANHVSWMDITLLGSVLPVSFVAKSEVALWPVLGTLARLQRTVFVERTRRRHTAHANHAIARRVGQGDVMVLFAEGTTGDGNSILPFKSALFGAAGAFPGGSVTVQPVALSYVAVGGIPVGRPDRARIAWYGDMDFLPHFCHLAGCGAIDAVVSFGEPILFRSGDDRKVVAEACRTACRQMALRVRHGGRSNDAVGIPLFSRPPKGAKASLGEAPGAG